MFARFDDYDFQHWIADQADYGDVAAVHKLFGHQNSQQKNSWFTIRVKRNELSGYLNDLDIALQRAKSAANQDIPERPDAVALLARYALIQGVIKSLAGNHPPQLYTDYLLSGLWTLEQALAWARISDRPDDAMAGVISVLQIAGGADLNRIGALALLRGAEISSSDNRVLALADNIDKVPAFQIENVLVTIAQEPNQGSKSGALIRAAARIPQAMQWKTVEIAMKFDDIMLRAYTVAGIATHMSGALYDDAMKQVIADVKQNDREYLDKKNHLTDDSKAWEIDYSRENDLDRLTSVLPVETLETLSKVLEAPSRSVEKAIMRKRLEAIASARPYYVLENMDRISELLSNDCDQAFQMAVLALVEQQDYTGACALLNEMSTGDKCLKTDTLLQIITHVPPPEQIRLVEIFKSLWDIEKFRALRLFAETNPAYRDVLDQLTATFTDEREYHAARACAAAALSYSELTEEVEFCVQHREYVDRTSDLKYLAPFLNIEHIRTLLQVYPDLDKLNDKFFTELILRMGILEHPLEAIQSIAASRRIFAYDRANIFSRLASFIPDIYLVNILEATQPIRVDFERTQARIAIIQWLPPERVEAIIDEISSIDYLDERISLLKKLPLELEPSQLERAGYHMLTCIRDSLHSKAVQSNNSLVDCFRYLSQLLTRVPSSEIIERAIALAKSEEVLSIQGMVYTLVTLAGSGDPGLHTARALEEAIRLAYDQPELHKMIWSHLTQSHAMLISNLMREQTKPETLESLIWVGGHLFDKDARQRASAFIHEIDDPYKRLSLWGEFLEYLEPDQQKEIIQQELASLERDSDRKKLLSLATINFARYDSTVFSRYKREVYSIFAKEKIESTAYAGSNLAAAGEPDLLDMTLAAILKTSPVSSAPALKIVTNSLTDSQMTDMIDWLKRHSENLDKDLYIGLIERAIRLENDDLSRAVFSSLPDNTFIVSDILEATALHMPLAMISEAANLDRYSGHYLSVRAAQLGDFDMAMELFSNSGSGEKNRSFEKLCSYVTETEVDRIAAFAEQQDEHARALGIAKLASKMPSHRHSDFLMKAVEHLSYFRGAIAHERVRLMHELEPELNRLSLDDLVMLWTQALEDSANHERSETLLDIAAFAPVLIARFGADMALLLDNAILSGGSNTWV